MPALILERDSEKAVEIWSRYFGRNSHGRPFYSGSQFERFADGGDGGTRDVFTAEDIVAVSMLSVNVRAQSALRLLGPDRDRCSELLSAIPTDVTIAHAPADLLDAESAASKLWMLLRTPSAENPGARDGIGPTTTSKLLARKRPDLIPVLDSVVERVTGQGRVGSWAWFRAEMQRDDASLHRWLRQSAPHELSDISTLRLLDVLLWMTGSRNLP